MREKEKKGPQEQRKPMKKKTLSRPKRENRPTWAGFKPKKEATKRERLERARKKDKKENQECG